MLGNLDPAKMLVILVLALVVLGPERLPKVARQLGSAWRELTRMREQVADEVRSAIPDLDQLPRIPKIKPGSVSGFINDLARPPGGAGSTLASAGALGAGPGSTSASGAALDTGDGAGAFEQAGFGAAASASSSVGVRLADQRVMMPAWDDTTPALDDPSMN